MYLIDIRDANEGYLSFDLKEILEAITIGAQLTWCIEFYEFVLIGTKDEEVLRKIYEINNRQVNGTVTWAFLLRMAEVFRQTCDCSIKGVNSNCRVNISAIDTTCWEVETDNLEIMNSLLRSFKSVTVSHNTNNEAPT